MTDKELLIKEKELYLALVYLRLKEDLECINKAIEEKTPKDYTDETNVFKKGFGKGILNPVKQTILKDLEKDKEKALNNINAFEEKYGKNYDFSRGGIITKIMDCFRNDEKQEARTILALRVCLAEYEFIHREESLNQVSLLLFGDEKKALELYEILKNNYKQINKKSLKNVDNKTLKGLGIATAATILAGPIGFGVAALASKDVKDAMQEVAEIGAGEYGDDAANVTTAFVAAELLLSGGLCGGYTAYQISKNKELKDQFRGIDSESLALKLAVKATIIEIVLKTIEEDKRQMYLDEPLQILDDLRADAEYMIIVEKKDTEVAKKKLEICNNFINRLIAIVEA